MLNELSCQEKLGLLLEHKLQLLPANRYLLLHHTSLLVSPNYKTTVLSSIRNFYFYYVLSWRKENTGWMNQWKISNDNLSDQYFSGGKIFHFKVYVKENIKLFVRQCWLFDFFTSSCSPTSPHLSPQSFSLSLTHSCTLAHAHTHTHTSTHAHWESETLSLQNVAVHK